MTTFQVPVRAEPGSFRDPANRVFHSGDSVLRGLDERAAERWRALSASTFFPVLLAAGKVCGTEAVDRADLPADLGEPWAAVLRHERIPFVSHPYEWSFGMLREAALLHLEILRAALADGFTTSDGSAYNLQWRGVEPVFIDVGSFEPLRDGEPWAGYRQFCQTLLYPLLVQAHLGVDFQPWLRSRVDGIEPEQLRPLFRGARRLRRGVPTHVHLHAAMQQRNAAASTTEVRAQLRAAGWSRDLQLATVAGMEKLVRRLDADPAGSHWVDYQRTCGYTADDRAGKERFVAAALAAARPRLVLDLGANDGRYARVAARYADHVVAVEQDPAVVDRLYRRLRADGERRILPLVMDLADPSPGGGWRGVERAGFAERAADADAVLALAVVHHLAIGRNVPLPELVDWLVGFTRPGGTLVVEFVHPDDPMARRLLANKPAGLFPDYRPEVFERLLAVRGRIAHRTDLPSGTRTLYQVVVGG